MSLVLPAQHVAAQHVNLKLGPGLLQTSGDASTSAPPIFATRSTTTQMAANGGSRITHGGSYVPAAQESVIGVVLQKVGEGFRVEIGSAHAASLDGLAFQGATKRNKPNLKIGSLVYARVSLARKDMEPELECFDAQTRKSEGFGEVKGGFMVRCSLAMCRQLLDSKHFLLPMLGARFPLQTAIGVNGRVWVSAKDVRGVIGIARCIETVDPDSDGMDEGGITNLRRILGL
ncbi:exosome complex exonuclease RRP40 [Mycena alexandri]|uniref:Ribosomal RNA-processing protein 40 n=1 Tax=Mycena alexandri TaxID=1745969 RepID=A0AAD6SCI7_9AGAR|nr:exosome complex exonuclease RRP40 [Mycena alexandri]